MPPLSLLKRLVLGGGCALLLAGAVHPGLWAQDVTVQGPTWNDSSESPEEPARFSKPPRFSIPEPARTLAGPHYVAWTLVIDSKGKVLLQEFLSSSPALADLASGSERALEVVPARRGGRAVLSPVQVLLIINPASAGETEPESTPRLLQVVLPESPPGGEAQRLPQTEVQLAVDATGAVTGIVFPNEVPEAVRPVAQRALLAWRFRPARRAGADVEATVTVPLLWEPANALDLARVDELPRVIEQKAPRYPLGMRAAAVQAEVLVTFVVDRSGQVRDAYVARSSHPAFDESALEAVTAWKFEPGQRRGVPVNTRMQVPIVFSIEGGGREGFTIRRDPKLLAKLPEAFRYDTPPKLTGAMPAVYPFEALRAGVQGKVVAGFVVGRSGRAEMVEILQSPAPELGDAVRAMLDTFVFQPAMKDGAPGLALLRFEIAFQTNGMGDVPVGDGARRLLRELEREQPRIERKGLDTPPRPVSRRPPTVPSPLSGPVEGRAELEVIVDRNGLVQLPRVLSATDPALGYAAVQAVAAWRFSPATKNGRPVDVYVRIPVSFSTASTPREPVREP